MVDQETYNRGMEALKKLNEAGIRIEDLVDLFANAAYELTEPKTKIKNFLLRIGAKPSVKGFEYCVRILELGMDDPRTLKNLKSGAFLTVAKEFDVKVTNVDRHIRRVIDNIFDDMNDEAMKFFANLDYRNGNPTVKTFLTYVVDNFRTFK